MNNYRPENPYPEQPGFIRRIWMLIYPMLVYEAVSVIVALPFVMLIMLTKFSETAGMSPQEMMLFYEDQVYANYLEIAVITCVISIPLMLLFMHMDRKRERMLGIEERYESLPWYDYLLSFVCGISACMFLNHILELSGISQALSSGYEAVAELLFTGSVWMEILAVAVLTPIVEELIFRGLIYRRMRWMIGVIPATVMSAVYFGIFHGNLLQGIYAFALGILLAYTYEKYHNILAPVSIHIGANLISVLISDAGLFDFIYETEDLGPFIGLTAVMMLILTVTLYLIITGIHPARLDNAQTAVPDAGSQEEEEDWKKNNLPSA